MANKTFQQSLARYIAAVYNGVYVVSPEIDLILADIKAVILPHDGLLLHWNCNKGATAVTRNTCPSAITTKLASFGIDITAFLNGLHDIQQIFCEYTEQHSDSYAHTDKLRDANPAVNVMVVVFENLHLIWGNPVITQALISSLCHKKQCRCIHLVTGANVEIPPVLQHYFYEITRPVPTLDEIDAIARDYIKTFTPMNNSTQERYRERLNAEYNLLFPAKNRQAIFHAAHGLSESGVRDAFAMGSAVAGHAVSVDIKAVADVKVQRIHTSTALEVCTPIQQGLSALGGLDYLKHFVLRSTINRVDKTLTPKGVLLTGISGTGKTSFCRALGAELNLPVLRFGLGTLLDKYVGGSEQKTKQALCQIDQMSPVVVIIDEIEKLLAGSSRQGSDSDGGAMQRILSSILTWLQDRTNDTYVVGTCNEVEALPAELLRAGRFDAVFFMDFPTATEKRSIWNIYLQKYNIDTAKEKLPDDTEWTGTEIEQCCYFAKMWGQSLVEAADCLVPVARASLEKVQKIKQYATDKFLDATYGGLYTPTRKKS
jgi:hypothetical protein